MLHKNGLFVVPKRLNLTVKCFLVVFPIGSAGWGEQQDVKLQCGWKWICMQTCHWDIMFLILHFSLFLLLLLWREHQCVWPGVFTWPTFFQETALRPEVVKIKSSVTYKLIAKRLYVKKKIY